MGSNVRIIIDLAKSPRVRLEQDTALDLLECISNKRRITKDLEEAIRIIENFEEFYKLSRRRFEEYLAPPKNHRDVIMGHVVVHKLRLIRDNDKKIVEIVFDRRMKLEEIIDCLRQLGFDDIKVERQFI